MTRPAQHAHDVLAKVRVIVERNDRQHRPALTHSPAIGCAPNINTSTSTSTATATARTIKAPNLKPQREMSILV